MVLAATWLGGRKDRSQQHISLITKFFNDFAFIVQCSSKISCTFLALFDTIRYDTMQHIYVRSKADKMASQPKNNVAHGTERKK